MDIYSRMLTLAKDINMFKGIKVSRRSPSILHLFFADDALFFSKTSQDAYHQLPTVNQRFCFISGSKINLEKSYVKFSLNTTSHYQILFKNSIHMTQKNYVSSNLGISIIQISKIAQFNFLIDLISKKFLSWNSLFLLSILKLFSLIQFSLPCFSHILSSFSIPISVTNRLDSMITSFLWSNRDRSGLHWVKKEKIF